jgi:hypothetical protein
MVGGRGGRRLIGEAAGKKKNKERKQGTRHGAFVYITTLDKKSTPARRLCGAVSVKLRAKKQPHPYG